MHWDIASLAYPMTRQVELCWSNARFRELTSLQMPINLTAKLMALATGGTTWPQLA